MRHDIPTGKGIYLARYPTVSDPHDSPSGALSDAHDSPSGALSDATWYPSQHGIRMRHGIRPGTVSCYIKCGTWGILVHAAWYPTRHGCSQTSYVPPTLRRSTDSCALKVQASHPRLGFLIQVWSMWSRWGLWTTYNVTCGRLTILNHPTWPTAVRV